MHHIIVTTLISSEHQRMKEMDIRHQRGSSQSHVVATIRSAANRMSAIWQANRGSEPQATSLEQCECASQPSWSGSQRVLKGLRLARL